MRKELVIKFGKRTKDNVTVTINNKTYVITTKKFKEADEYALATAKYLLSNYSNVTLENMQYIYMVTLADEITGNTLI